MEQLAEFFGPSEVARMVMREFPNAGEWDRVRTAHYGGFRGPGKDLVPDLRELFIARRRQFLESVEEIPVFHRVVRLRRQEALDRVIAEALPETGSPNFPAVDRAVALLDLARREADPARGVTINTIAGGVTVNLDLAPEYADELARRFAQRRLPTAAS